MSNETKRDVFETIADKCAGYNDELYEELLKKYDDALPDNMPVIPNYVVEYINAEKNNTDVIQSGIEGNGDTIARAWLDGYRVGAQHER